MALFSTLAATPPLEMVMPPIGQSWMLYLNMIPAAVAVIFALRHWQRTRSPIGILLLLGGLLTAFNEPIVDVLGKCWFAPIGSSVFIKAWGISVPMFALPVYFWFMGGQAFLAYSLFERGIRTRGVFGLYLFGAITNLILELPALHFGLYTYWGNQPFVLAGLPLWWLAVNPLMPLMMAAVIFRLDFILQGARRLFVIPLVWMLAAATNGLIAAPVWVALNSDASLLVTHLAALVTFGMGIATCYGISLIIAVDAVQVRDRKGEPLQGLSARAISQN